METKDREVCVSKQDQEGQIGKKVKTKQKLMSKGWAKCEHKYVLNSDDRSIGPTYKWNLNFL